VGNAIKFTEAGSVTVSAEHSFLDGRSWLAVAVADTGCGITTEGQAKLFGAFTQLDSTSTRKHEGTGLGLHLSQKLAEMIGGRIECTSSVGSGSIFRLLVPEN
jgi:signal transduction histidine kinase